MRAGSRTLLVVIGICALFLSGCAGTMKNVPLPQDFAAKKGTVGLVFLTTPEHPKPSAMYYNIGAQGLLDTAINRSIAGKLIDRLEKEDISPLVKQHYLTVFNDALSLNGFQVKTSDGVYDHKLLKRVDREMVKDSSTKFIFSSYTYDYAPIFEELKTDYLMILEVYRFGVGRNYFGFVPTGSPKAWTALKCSLVERTSNSVIGQHFARILEEVNGEWDEPPEYPILMKAVSVSFEKSVDEIFTNLFQRAP